MKNKIFSLIVCCLFIGLASPVFAGVDYSIKVMENDYRRFISRTNSQLRNYRAATLKNDQRDRRRYMKEFRDHYNRMIKDAKQRLRDFREYVSLQSSSLETTRIRQRDTQDMIRRNRVVLRDKNRMQKEVLRNNKEKLKDLRIRLRELTRK